MTEGAPHGPLTRREFLRTAAAAGMVSAIVPAALGAEEEEAPRMPMRPLGRTGLTVSLFGLGCYYLGRMTSDAEAVRVVRRALDHGVNYLDTAPSYKAGTSERRVAAALRGRRERVILATKSYQRQADRVLEELEASLRRLGTDRVDLFQMHSLRDGEDLDERFGPGGAIEGFVKAREQGKARFLGVTGHVDPEVMVEALGRFDFDTVLVPLNCVDPHYFSFQETTLPKAKEKAAGLIAMKVFAAGNLVQGETPPVTEEDCIRYVATLPVSTMILGCDKLDQVDRDAAAMKPLRPLSEAERKALVLRTARVKGRGTEWYKRKA